MHRHVNQQSHLDACLEQWADNALAAHSRGGRASSTETGVLDADFAMGALARASLMEGMGAEISAAQAHLADLEAKTHVKRSYVPEPHRAVPKADESNWVGIQHDEIEEADNEVIDTICHPGSRL